MSYFDTIAPQLAAGAFNPQLYSPWAGVSMLPKSSSNFGAAAPAIATNRLPIDLMNAVTNAGSAASDAMYKGALAQRVGTQNQLDLANLGFLRQLMQGTNEDDYTPQTSSAAPGVNAAPTGAGVGSPAPSASTSASSSGGGMGPLAQPVVAQLRQEGWTDAAIAGALANGQAEGQFNEPWQKSPGKENSYGHWQFNDQGELPGYMDFVKSAGGNPQDSAMQARYLASRMEELVPGFGQITDPKVATNLIESEFEKPAKQTSRMGQLMLAQNYLAKNAATPGPQYAQANTGTATDATPDTGVRPPPTPGTLIENGGVPGITANRAQGTATPFARQLVAAGVNMPRAEASSPTFAPGVAPGGAAGVGALQGAPNTAPAPGSSPSTVPAAVPNAPVPPAGPAPGAPMPMVGQPAPPAAPAPGGPPAAPYMPYTPQQIARAQANARMFVLTGHQIPPQIQQVLSFAPGGANDPQAVAAKAQAQAAAQKAAELQYAGPIAAAQMPYKGVRPGGAFPVPGPNGLPSGQFITAPTVQTRIVNGVPTQVYSQQTPNGPVETPIPGQSAFTPQQTAQGEAQGKANVALGTAGPIASAEETAKEQAAAEQKQRQKVIDDANVAQKSQATLVSMANEIPNFTQGPFSQHVQAAGEYMRLIDPSWNGQVAGYEDFVKNAGALTRATVKEVSGRAAAQEFRMIQDTLPNPDMSPMGMRRVTNELMGLNDFSQAKAQAQQAWEQKYGTVHNFEANFQNQVSPYAYIVARMDPTDRKTMFAQLQQTDAGRQQLAKIGQQLQFIKGAGLDMQ